MNRQRTDYIVIHTAATPPDWDIGADEIRHLHTAPKTESIPWGPYTLKGKAWSDIGYHFVIDRKGRIETGRDADAVGAHVKGYNQISIAVCLVGGISASGKAEDNYTDAQWRSLKVLLRLLRLRYPDAEILGHRDLSPDANGDGVITRADWLKECPSFDVREKVAEWNRAAA